jgi:putative ABC transport system permease protein
MMAVVYRQIDFMRTKALGFDQEKLIYIPLRGETQASYPALKAELLRSPLIPGVTGTSQVPTYISANSWGAEWEGKDPENRVLIGTTVADFDYPETLGIAMAAGRPFRREYATDEGGAFLVNEETARLMGLTPQDAVGKPFSFQGIRGPIVGVMKNYHYTPVQNPLEPMAVIIRPAAVQFAIARLGGGDVPGAMAQVESAWRAVNPQYPFDYRFFDDDYDQSYRQYERMGAILRWFAGLAVVVACLGLFGLASFLAEQRRKGDRRPQGPGRFFRTGRSAAVEGVRPLGPAGQPHRLAGGLFRGLVLAAEVPLPDGFRRVFSSWRAPRPWPSLSSRSAARP